MWKKSSLLLALLTSAIFSSPSSVTGQYSACDALRPVAGSPTQYKDRGNRCEGLYVADVGAPNIDFVSLTYGAISFSLKEGETLRVRVPNAKENVHVRAVAKPAHTYYRMDAVLDPGSELSWPVQDVLLPENIGANRIGIYAFRDDGNKRVFFPVQTRAGSTNTNASVQEPVRLSVRPTFDADSIKWRWSAASQGSCTKFGNWQDAVTLSVDAGQSVDVLLKGNRGLICVEVSAKVHDRDDWSTLKLLVEIPAP